MLNITRSLAIDTDCKICYITKKKTDEYYLQCQWLT